MEVRRGIPGRDWFPSRFELKEKRAVKKFVEVEEQEEFAAAAVPAAAALEAHH